MPAPSATVEILDSSPPRASLTDTGTKFLVGLANKGKTTGTLSASDVITSLADFEDRHGTRQSYNGPDYDSVEAHFADGGSRLFFSRIVGPSAVTASITVPSSSPQGTFTAKGPGAYANGGTITITSGVATVVVDGETEVSPTLATVQDLLDWATNVSTLVDYTPSVSTGTALSNSAARTLASGADDRTNITDTERQAAIDRFGKNLGPGQVAMPSRPTIEGHTILATHARDTNRFAHGDPTDTATAATVVAQGEAIRALDREIARHIQLLDPWLIAPGQTTGTTRTIPPSAIMGGLTAKVDAAGNPNTPIAGDRAVSTFATDVKNVRTDDERDDLADAGVTEIVNDNGQVMPFDDITPVDPDDEPEWLAASGNRLVMRIVQDALAIARSHMFSGIRSQADLVDYAGDLEGMLAGWLNRGALFSDDGSAAGAFRVSVLDPVNTTATLQAKQLNAALALKITPNSRFVTVKITNTPLTGTL